MLIHAAEADMHFENFPVNFHLAVHRKTNENCMICLVCLWMIAVYKQRGSAESFVLDVDACI